MRKFVSLPSRQKPPSAPAVIAFKTASESWQDKREKQTDYGNGCRSCCGHNPPTSNNDVPSATPLSQRSRVDHNFSNSVRGFTCVTIYKSLPSFPYVVLNE